MRALPARTIDLIRDGARLRGGGDRAVFRALVSTAASALQHGWTFSDWHALVTESRSRLGQQAKTKGGRKERTRQQFQGLLRDAWTAAERWLAEHPPIGRDEVALVIAAARAYASDSDADLSDNERAVLTVAVQAAERNHTTRPALPWRSVREGTGLPERTTKNTIAGLGRRGLLVCEDRGRPAGPGAARRRAACYRLPDPGSPSYLYRVPRSVGPPVQVCGTPAGEGSWDPPQVCGTPRATDPPSTAIPASEQEPEMLSVTVTGHDPAAVARVLAALHREFGPDAEVATEPRLSVIPGGRADDANRQHRGSDR